MAPTPSAPESGAFQSNTLPSGSTNLTQSSPSHPSATPRALSLEKARLDFLNFRTQTTFGLMLVALVCLIGFSSVFSIGFLLDDFLHFDYVSRTASGDWQPFLSNLYSNWGGSDLMKSYRPLASISIFADYIFWKSNAWGYHVTNALLLVACAFLTAATTGELTGRSGNRTGAAAGIWAALLFAVYPLHAESVAWIIGRVDLLCTLFYLGSVFLFLRFQSTSHKHLLAGSLASFALALASKEMAVTLPVVIFLASLLLPADDCKQPKQLLRNALLHTAFFLAVLATFTLIRYFALATTIGGYGELSRDTIVGAIRNFLDRASLVKIIVPLNEELQIRSPFNYAPVWAVATITALAAVRTFITPTLARTVLFLALWCAIALAPTFQIWHIHPNLVGSRLFFLSSAPLCMLIALCAVPSLDQVSRRAAIWLTVPGLISLLALFFSWAWMLNLNLIPWQEAGKRMQTLKSQLLEIGSSVPDGKRALLLDLPTDFQGAGMLTRNQYLNILTRPPLFPRDYADRFATIEPVGPGNHELVWPSQLHDKIEMAHQAYRWNPQNGRFQLWETAELSDQPYHPHPMICDSSMLGKIEVEPPETTVVSAAEWHTIDQNAPRIEGHKSFLRLYPGARGSGLTAYCCSPPSDSTAIGMLRFKAVLHPSSPSTRMQEQSKATLVWHSADGTSGTAPLLWKDDEMIAVVGCHRAWCEGAPAHRVGLHLSPGQYYLDVYQVEATPMSRNRPTVRPAKLTPQTYAVDASSIPGTEKIRLLVSKPNMPFDLQSDSDAVYSPLPQGSDVAEVLSLSGNSGSLTLPQSVYNTAGIYGISAVALDKTGAPIGFPSEPVTFEVRSSK